MLNSCESLQRNPSHDSKLFHPFILIILNYEIINTIKPKFINQPIKNIIINYLTL